VAVLAGSAGYLFGIAELDGIGAAAAVAVIAAWAWTARQDFRLELRRSLHPAQPAPGQRNAVEVRVGNVGGRRTPVLVLHDPFDGSGPRKLLAPLGPRGSRVWRYELPELRRGSFSVGPLVAEVDDPFGLARKAVTVGEASRLVVHPRVLPLRLPVIARASRAEGVSAASGDGGQEMSELREYVPGDDVRRIHWPSSARTDTVLVREDRVERLGRVLVALDLRRGVWTDPALECALEAAASVASDACSRGLQVRLAATDGSDSGLGSSPRHLARILDQLATVVPHPGGVLFGPSRDSGAPSPRGIAPSALAASDHTIICTSDRVTTDDFRAAVNRRRRAPMTVVVADTATRRGFASPPGARTVRVSPGQDFASAWQKGAPR
jgi:uncharacterized protein (DUF58 family)